MIDISKVDKLIQYIVLVAGQEDDAYDRELGPIHLIKYLYLADLAYAASHDGRTYTGLPWRFHHYGPYCQEAYQRLEPALRSIDADQKTIQSIQYENDFIRWSKSDDELHDQFSQQLDLSLSGVLHRLVYTFGADTAKLLDFTYKTKPMLNAAPGDPLDFTLAKAETASVEAAPATECEPLTRRQEKKRSEQLSQLKSKLKQRLSTRVQPKFKFTAPRYDEVFFQGLEQLDAALGESIAPGDYRASFSEDIWKSKARSDPGLS